MKRFATATTLALVLATTPAQTETCQECLDMLDINEGVKCWQDNGCVDKITSNTGGNQTQSSFEELWRENRERPKGTLETPTARSRPSMPDVSIPETPSVSSTPSVPGRRLQTPGR